MLRYLCLSTGGSFCFNFVIDVKLSFKIVFLQGNLGHMKKQGIWIKEFQKLFQPWRISALVKNIEYVCPIFVPSHPLVFFNYYLNIPLLSHYLLNFFLIFFLRSSFTYHLSSQRVCHLYLLNQNPYLCYIVNRLSVIFRLQLFGYFC